MTMDEFARLLAARIPTAEEFLAFAAFAGWRVVATPSGPALRVPDRTDPLAVAFAKLLSREPYRTNVLAAAGVPKPAKPLPPPPPPEPEPWVCGVCNGTVYVTEAEWRGVAGVLCPRDGEWAAVPSGGPPKVVQERCPHKPTGGRR